MRFAFIAKNADMLPIERMCQIMDVSPRGYRAFRRRPLSHSQRKDMVVLDVAGTTVRVLQGVFSGIVRFDPERSSIEISDSALAKSVDDYGIISYLEKPVSVVLSAWHKLSAFLPRADATQLRSGPFRRVETGFGAFGTGV